MINFICPVIALVNNYKKIAMSFGFTHFILFKLNTVKLLSLKKEIHFIDFMNLQ